MMHFGIIGQPLAHSFSAKYFNEMFHTQKIEAEYSVYPLEKIEDLPELLKIHRFRGLNVTMPYKQSVIRYLDTLDGTAQAIGAVNVIRIDEDGHRRGYNTDAIGFINDIRPQLQPNDKRALVLGTGGAAQAVCYGLHELGLEVQMVSRDATRGICYEALTPEIVAEHSVVVNTTPLGMHPLQEEKANFPYHLLKKAHFLYDVIYNPAKTLFLKEGERRGCRISNGMGMLYQQAQAAWGIWTN